MRETTERPEALDAGAVEPEPAQDRLEFRGGKEDQAGVPGIRGGRARGDGAHQPRHPARIAIDIGDQIVTAFLFDQQFINSIDGSANNLPSTAGSPQSDVDHWLHGWVLATPLGAVC